MLVKPKRFFFLRYTVIKVNYMNKQNGPTVTSEYTSNLYGVTNKTKGISMDAKRETTAPEC